MAAVKASHMHQLLPTTLSLTGSWLCSSAFNISNSHSKQWFKFLLLWFPAGPVLRSAVLEDCALCQETISSSELAAKAREGQFEGQQIYKWTNKHCTCQPTHCSPLSQQMFSLWWFCLALCRPPRLGSWWSLQLLHCLQGSLHCHPQEASL